MRPDSDVNGFEVLERVVDLRKMPPIYTPKHEKAAKTSRSSGKNSLVKSVTANALNLNPQGILQSGMLC